jgi:two-component system chemotaxis response regulator CheB
MKPVRVLVVDDSATMRAVIASTLSRDPAIEVVGMAADPLEAREAVKALNPDVMTLDVEMPKMDGLAFLDKVMRLRPLPVVMVSTLTARGASAAIKAMELGAVSCVGKPSIDHPNAFDALPATIMAAAGAQVANRTPASSFRREQASGSSYHWDGKIVAIGASTGCVESLISVIAQYPANCPPTLITVHMPGAFTRSFASRLDGLTEAQVQEAEDGAVLLPGHVYVAPGGVAHLEAVCSGKPKCRLRDSNPVNGHRPSVDVLFDSVAKSLGPKAVGVILTGMGRDGAAGLLAMRQAGARTLGQNEATCVVYGMPKAALHCGAIEQEASIHDIGKRILALTSKEGR